MSDTRNRQRLSLNRDARQGPVVEERLHKVLANAGLGSRRLLEERIGAGEVRVNATPVDIGTSIKAGDRVELDGKAFIAVTTEPDDLETLVYHKPEGEVTTHDDPEGRPTVFENLPPLKGARWVSVGRLDINTTGLLLLTTDGEMANALMHPSSEVEREYVCRIHGSVDEAMLERLGKGVELEDGPARFDQVAVISLGENHSWLRVTLKEGRNREVRRIWESQGVQVSRLKRIRYGSVELPRHLRRGRHEVLDPAACRALRASLGLADAPMTLTLQPVIGVRRAARTQNEFKPDARSQRAWSGAHADEAREIRAFDFVRDEPKSPRGRPGGRRRGKNSGPGGMGHGHGGAGPGQRAPRNAAGEANGNVAPVPRGERGARPGRNAGPGRGPGGPGRGPGGPGRGPGGPGRGPGGPGRGPGGPGRGAGAGQGRGPGSGPGRGPGGPGRNPAEIRSWSPGGAKPGQAAGKHRRGGKKGGPGAASGMPFGFPSDHAYARRDDAPTNPRPAGSFPGAPRPAGASRRRPPGRGRNGPPNRNG
jgi:23S rRNA pseudouridine2605 synthase